MDMIKGIYQRNRGQFHPAIAGVWDVPEELVSNYRGCGEVIITVDNDLKLQGIRYLEMDEDLRPLQEEEPSTDPAAGVYHLRGSASCYQVMVEHGTSSAAIIAALSQPEGA
ncbi:MAG: hypothetical protein IT209_00660 [Armatimonadetes bacterium]|nr:hypothetical protein [Armatimonadota bacterium]